MDAHTQFGWLTMFALTGAVAVIGMSGGQIGSDAHGRGTLLVAQGLMLIPLFGWLTVTVDPEAVLVRFGVGLLRKKVLLRDIKSATRVRNKWYYGWGMRMGPWGWMYNVSGLDAVEIELKNGGKFRVGTDEPEELVSAIRSSLFGFGR